MPPHAGRGGLLVEQRDSLVRIAGEESERLLRMEEELHNRIVGQDEAISIAARIPMARKGIVEVRQVIDLPAG